MDNLRIERKTVDSVNIYDVVDGLHRVPGGPYECRQVAEQALMAERTKKQHVNLPLTSAEISH